ncbi:two-component system, chemotaxis family, response regulator CheB [Allopseudospirillum japonicum]|uniref:Protein-glutamate methylesterase/protein-glutamine glutaminase n=1 Tax=Allopseudospirillum japonicum TaxID=64971 RepID=A0A1H6QVG6_9GAMM|nr:chemotaxis response regulator protein-glutamate methylesterase [Allopseudospirillum japonicum]SEI46056.1 two-component system, chemotaxis family, response regulator CheB [Allopseudospirillum japonicum]
MAVTVLVVDDSGFFRRRVCELLKQDPRVQVVGTASNGQEAVDKVLELKPDVVTMDYEMPVLDGISAVRKIMHLCPTPVLMFSSLTHEGARITLAALEAGAVDYLPKNFEDVSRNSERLARTLCEKILIVARTGRAGLKALTQTWGRPKTTETQGSSSPQAGNTQPPHQAPKSKFGTSDPISSPSDHWKSTKTYETNKTSTSIDPARAALRERIARRLQEQKEQGQHGVSSLAKADHKTPPTPASRPRANPRHFHLVAIGTSTGGPMALQNVLTQLPANFPVPLVLIQHMPAAFTGAFAERLNGLCKIEVKEAEDGDILRPGRALLAPGGKQMMIERRNQACVRILAGDERLNYKPSVDITFGSAARCFANKVLAIVLTGMGADGREGARLLKESGSVIWAQDEASSVIYGMPMAIAKAGLADEIINLKDLPEKLISDVLA